MSRDDLLCFMDRQGIPRRTASGSRSRVAIVDDDPTVVRAIERILRRARPDLLIRTAQNGFEAGVVVASFVPDVIFLDVVMPGISGVEVCATIRSTPELAGTRVVIISGHLTAKLRVELAAVGANALIEKPFSSRDILEALPTLHPSPTDARS